MAPIPERARFAPGPHVRVVDLFCGAGGLSLGLKAAGWTVVRAIDHGAPAVETYRRNLGDHVVRAEIDLATDLPAADLISGGPPCQGFSSAGQRRTGDHRNTLVSVFAQLVVRHRPRAFLFENVEGFLTGEDGQRVLDLLLPTIAAGYRVHLRKVNVANFGVPQHRKRVIAIGGLGWTPSLPEPTHSAFGAPGAVLAAKHLPRTPTLAEALEGLGPAAAEAPGSPQGHFSAALPDDDRRRVQALLPGQTMRDLPEELWHDSYRRRAFRRVMDGTPTERRGGAPAGVRRLRPDEPAKAITSFARAEFVHPGEDRYLTLRECARIQSFPDDFEFVGSVADQALLIGNAVPAAFARALGVHLAKELASAVPESEPGALLSFVPTLSAGMSPALRRVADCVAAALGPREHAAPQGAFAWD